MSEYGDYDGGFDYDHAEAGQQHETLDQLHQASGSQEDYNSTFGVYEADHASAENTEFQQGHQVEYTDPNGAHYAESDFTNYSHSEAETDHVFAAEGSEHYSASEWNQLDALHHELDTAFASATQISAVSA